MLENRCRKIFTVTCTGSWKRVQFTWQCCEKCVLCVDYYYYWQNYFALEVVYAIANFHIAVFVHYKHSMKLTHHNTYKPICGCGRTEAHFQTSHATFTWTTVTFVRAQIETVDSQWTISKGSHGQINRFRAFQGTQRFQCLYISFQIASPRPGWPESWLLYAVVNFQYQIRQIVWL